MTTLLPDQYQTGLEQAIKLLAFASRANPEEVKGWQKAISFQQTDYTPTGIWSIDFGEPAFPLFLSGAVKVIFSVGHDASKPYLVEISLAQTPIHGWVVTKVGAGPNIHRMQVFKPTDRHGIEFDRLIVTRVAEVAGLPRMFWYPYLEPVEEY